MSSRATDPLRRLVATWSRSLQRAWSRANDAYLGIRTEERQRLDRTLPFDSELTPKYADRVPYQGADYRNLRRIIRRLRLSPRDVFFDIGCGQGRVLCLVARERLSRVIGIELSPQLCAIALRNASQVRGRRTPIEIRCEDAAEADLAGGTVYFLYNPFGPETLRDVLGNIRRSLCIRRALTVVYYNSVHAELLDSSSWLHRMAEFQTLTGKVIGFWQTVI